jgi:uncharacterized membrane protein YhhN
MVYVPACFFIVVSVIHLAGCIVQNKKLRTVTKPLLMPLLALTAAAVLIPLLPDSQHTLTFILAALACGTAGDVFLISSDKKYFIAGALCFLTGHFFWISLNCRAFSSLPRSLAVIGIVCIVVFLAAAYLIAGKPKGAMGVCTVIYSAVLCMLVFTGAAAVYAYGTTAAMLYLAGALVFLLSDTILGYSILKKKFPIADFLVMFTYITGQALLTAAVVLPQLQQHLLK